MRKRHRGFLDLSKKGLTLKWLNKIAVLTKQKKKRVAQMTRKDRISAVHM